VKVVLQSTTKIVEFEQPGGARIECRVWEGVTEGGVRCHAYIPRIAAASTDDLQEFERDLKEHAAPSETIRSIPLRMIL
jgi:hypothetical protein